jgi:peptidoglycan/LPS O-acetylase OafA/YrhL
MHNLFDCPFPALATLHPRWHSQVMLEPSIAATAADQSSPATDRPQLARVTDLDGMRGVLALCIVAFHLGSTAAIQKSTGWPGVEFELAVDVFFLLSGYVLALTAGADPLRFSVKRFLRLAPVYYVTLGIMLAAAPDHAFHLSELALAPPLLGRSPANFPAWSICWELYLPVAGLVLARLFKPARWWLPLLILALVVHALVAVRVADGEVLGGARAACGLVAGACLTRARSLPLPVVLPFAGIAATMFLAAKWSWLAVLLPFFGAAAILSAAHRRALFSREPFQFLGKVSFAVYMVHVPLIALVDPGHSIPLKALVVAVSIAAGYALHRWLEMPGMRLGKKLTQPQPR